MCSENLRNVLDNRRHNYARLGSHLQSVKREPKKYQFGSWHIVSRLCCDAMQKHTSRFFESQQMITNQQESKRCLPLPCCCGVGRGSLVVVSITIWPAHCPACLHPLHAIIACAWHTPAPLTRLVQALTPMLCPNTQCMPLVGTGTTSAPLTHSGPVPMCSLGDQREILRSNKKLSRPVLE